MRFKFLKILAVAVQFLTTTPARAEWLTFEMHWASPHSGMPVRVDGFATFEVIKQADGSYKGGANIDTVRDYSVTITNAGYGNGTFTELKQTSDWEPWGRPGSIRFSATPNIDLTKELVGQAGFPAETDPTGINRQLPALAVFGPMAAGFVYQTVNFNERWDPRGEIVLTSAKVLNYYVPPTSVPELETYMMMLAGISLLGVSARSRSSRKKCATRHGKERMHIYPGFRHI